MNSSRQNAFDNVSAIMDLLNLLNSLNSLAHLTSNLTTEFEKIEGRRWWVRPANVRRELQGAADNLVQEIRNFDEDSFFNFTRLNLAQFENLLSIVGPHLEKKSIRPSIAPETRLLLTLRYLATGDSFKSMHYLFRIGHSTIPKIIQETCNILYEELKETCIPELNENAFMEVSAGFENRTKFPHVAGAIDGKHIAIRAPPNSGTLYYNYKKHFSIVLLGVCDSQYKFIYFNIGAFGSESDGGVFRSSGLAENIENGIIQFPTARRIYGSNFDVPYVFLADAAFPLREYQMTPFCGRSLGEGEINYNLELSKGRSAIENAFGVLSARWRVLLNTMSLHPKNADKIVLASVLLHNYIISDGRSTSYLNDEDTDHYVNGSIVPENWRTQVGSQALQSIRNLRLASGANETRIARNLRNKIKDLLLLRD